MHTHTHTQTYQDVSPGRGLDRRILHLCAKGEALVAKNGKEKGGMKRKERRRQQIE
jgi:hypothetical protein